MTMDSASAGPGVQAGDSEPVEGRMRITLKFRVKDKHTARLDAQARAVNFVWNYCNETQRKAARDGRKWLSGYDLWKLVAGATKEGLDLHSHSAMRVCQEYDKSRRQQRKPWLRWRGRKSLGWVPFNTGHVALRDGGFIFRGQRYNVWLHRAPPAGAKFGAGSFNADSRGRWYINLPVELETAAASSIVEVGIDLGLTTLATLSTGEKIAMPRHARVAAQRLAAAQRARKKPLIRSRHAKVKNQRKDHLHKVSARIAASFGLIAVGNVSPSKLARTSMAKSVLDAGWSDFRSMLRYKSIRNGGRYIEVDEANTTQTCSTCGTKPPSRPKGIAGLRIRQWECDDCGAVHDRDVNAALNIARLGHQALVEGASA
jgi:IS605 OrfB family transposase